MSTTTTFSRTDDLGPQTVAVSSVFAVLATLAVAGRLCSRRVKRVAYGADDYMIVVALVCISTCSIKPGKLIDI